MNAKSPISEIAIDYDRARQNMVESQIKPGGVRDTRLCAAMMRIPREQFVAQAQMPIAYMDGDIRLSPSRTLLDPLTFARLVELAVIQPSDVVLDIACATGYSTAILATLASAVVGVEQDDDLATRGTAILSELGVDNGFIINAPHHLGQPKQAPYEVIFINGYVPHVPDGLLAQLAENGRLVCLTTHDGRECGVVFHKSGDGIGIRPAFEAKAELVSGFEQDEAFAF